MMSHNNRLVLGIKSVAWKVVRLRSVVSLVVFIILLLEKITNFCTHFYKMMFAVGLRIDRTQSYPAFKYQLVFGIDIKIIHAIIDLTMFGKILSWKLTKT